MIDGDTYDGQWVAGSKEGWGLWKGANGNSSGCQHFHTVPKRLHIMGAARLLCSSSSTSNTEISRAVAAALDFFFDDFDFFYS